MIAILLLDIQTNKFIAFPNSHHLRTNFPNYKGPGPKYKWVEKSPARLFFRIMTVMITEMEFGKQLKMYIPLMYPFSLSFQHS